MIVSINRLAELTGKSRNTIRKRLAPMLNETDGQKVAHALDSQRALALIYGEGAGDLDPMQEKALLDRARRHLAELEIEERKKTLIPADQVSRQWDSVAAAIRAKLLNLPGRLTTITYGAATFQEAEKQARTLIHEALAELAASGKPQ
jgi:hypothetical protein